MFTGLVEQIATVTDFEIIDGDARLTIGCGYTDLQLGESIAVDGACFTVTAFDGTHFQALLSSETLSCTIASQYLPGTMVNLERALKIGDRLGGHFVLGHIDQVAAVHDFHQQHDCYYLAISGITSTASRYLSEKGSVAINGVSLTIHQLHPDGCAVMIIPHTYLHTNLSELGIGSMVNIEFDTLAKLTARQFQIGGTPT